MEKSRLLTGIPVKFLLGESLKCRGILEKRGIIYFQSLEDAEEISKEGKGTFLLLKRMAEW